VFTSKGTNKGTGIDGALKQDEQPVALATTFALMLPEIVVVVDPIGKLSFRH
jgi:hypothetical protein